MCPKIIEKQSSDVLLYVQNYKHYLKLHNISPGGLGSTTTASNIFGTTATSSSVTQGLGGVDPKLANSNSSASGGSNKKW